MDSTVPNQKKPGIRRRKAVCNLLLTESGVGVYGGTSEGPIDTIVHARVGLWDGEHLQQGIVSRCLNALTAVGISSRKDMAGIL